MFTSQIPSYTLPSDKDSAHAQLCCAILIPLYRIDEIWEELCTYERQICGKANADRTITPLLPGYTTAHRVSKEILQHEEGILQSETAVGKWGVGSEPSFSEPEHILMGKWKSYLRWEESNPLGCETYSPELLEWISFTYHKALTSLGQYPKIW